MDPNYNQPSRIDLSLLGQQYAAYRTCPEMYLIEQIRIDNPFPQHS